MNAYLETNFFLHLCLGFFLLHFHTVRKVSPLLLNAWHQTDLNTDFLSVLF